MSAVIERSARSTVFGYPPIDFDLLQSDCAVRRRRNCHLRIGKVELLQRRWAMLRAPVLQQRERRRAQYLQLVLHRLRCDGRFVERPHPIQSEQKDEHAKEPDDEDKQRDRRLISEKPALEFSLPLYRRLDHVYAPITGNTRFNSSAS